METIHTTLDAVMRLPSIELERRLAVLTDEAALLRTLIREARERERSQQIRQRLQGGGQ